MGREIGPAMYPSAPRGGARGRGRGLPGGVRLCGDVLARFAKIPQCVKPIKRVKLYGPQQMGKKWKI